MICKKIQYLWSYFLYGLHVIWYAKILRKKRAVPAVYAGKRVLSAQEGNEFIYKKILSGQPFMAGRFGSVEISAVLDVLAIRLKLKKHLKSSRLMPLVINAGFFPDKEDYVLQFGDMMLELSDQVDLLAIWSLIMEDYIIKNYMPSVSLTHIEAVEPYYHSNPWSAALAGKKVLVIHPFEKSIQKQYQKREKLFENPAILPEFELKTLKAVQTIAGQKSEFNSWFEALNDMYTKAIQTDFDVALIGCGAYGFPLAAMLKRAGKQAIHMGGATQLLFGIMGARWEKNPLISKMCNAYWTRPDLSETPEKAKIVENGCYW